MAPRLQRATVIPGNTAQNDPFGALFSAMLQAAPQPVFVKDRLHRVRYMNDAGCELFGLSREHVIGRTDHELVPKHQADAFSKDDDRVFETGEEYRVEERVTTGDGRHAVLVTFKRRITLQGPDGDEDFVVATVWDRTVLREAQEHYHYTVSLNPQLTWTADPDGMITEVADRWRDWTGLAPEEALGEGWITPVHPDDVSPVLLIWRDHLKSGEPVDLEYRLRGATGTYNWFRARAAARRDSAGAIVRWYGTLEDINDRKIAEDALRESEMRFRAMADGAPVMIWVADADGGASMFNRGWQEFTGQTESDARGFGWLQALHPEDRQTAMAAFEEANEERRCFSVEYRLRRANGSFAWVLDTGQPRHSPEGNFLGYVGSILDISERREAQEKMLYAANHDPLTGLPNRKLLDEFLYSTLAALEPGKYLALLIVDLDGFKGVNDTLGHLAGDTLLLGVAQRLRSCVGPMDLVARFGGDEFAIALPHDGEQAERLARAVLQEISGRPFDLKNLQVSVGASIGIAFAPAHGGDSEQLMRKADIALYEAKGRGRGTFCLFNQLMDDKLRARQNTTNDLAGALDRAEFELHFQPIVSLDTGEVTSCEALVRWRHPERGLVYPGEFISVAEETGLIVPLGQWVLEQACLVATTWPPHVCVAVNLSAVQFRSAGMVEAVQRALVNSGLSPERLEIEVTESVLLDATEANLEILQDLRMLGVRVALDDFGTGYSSLNYLRSFAFDKIKVDRAFAQDLPDSPQALAIIRAVVGMSRSLGMKTTIEGIETVQQLQVVSAEGFDEAQGYLFSRPVVANDIPMLCRRSTHISATG